MKKRIFSVLLTLILCLSLVPAALAAEAESETGFDATVSIDRSVTGQISVTVSADDAILAEKQPDLSIPCTYTYVQVTGPGGDVAATVADGMVSFTVAAGGTYTVQQILGVTFDANGGSCATVSAPCNAEGKLVELPTPTYSGYTFNGWFTAASGGTQVDADTVFTEDCTVYAQWTLNYVPSVTPSAPATPTTPEVEAPSVDTDAPVVDSTTTENTDGSTTKSETLENGTVVETTTKADGSTTETATKTETVETEESKTTTTTTVTTNTSASGETVKESVQEVKEEKADGSAITITTTVTESETKTEKTEVKEETVVKEDGSAETKTTATTETELSNGSTGTTTVDETGAVTAEVAVSNTAVTEAAAANTAVELAMPAVEAAKASDETTSAATVTVSLPAGTESATVAIPVAEGTGAGTVAVIVNADGTETVITESKVTENGLEVEVPDGAVVKVVDNSTDFADISDNDWEKDAVDFTSARGIMNGTSTGENATFDSDTPTTRAMVWTMLARLSGVDTTPAEGEDWWTVGQKWAMENGISDGTMHDGAITREQLATMLHRYAGKPETDHDISHFEDHHETSDWALEAKQWAVENGVINGVGQADGSVTLDPQGNAIRSHVAQMFMNFMKNVGA